MVLKFESKTHLLYKFFLFLAPFFGAFGFKVWKQYKYDQQIFFGKNKKGIKKRRNLGWFQIRWKITQMHQNKVISKSSFTNIGKSGKKIF